MSRPVATDIDDYIKGFPAEVQALLQAVRATICKELPQGVEAIKYAIPTFMVSGKNLVHFAAFTKHIGLYPPPRGDEALNQELEPYRKGKGTLQFPLDKPMPYELIAKIARQLLRERP